MPDTVKKKAINSDTAEQTDYVARPKAYHFPNTAISPSRMLPIPVSPRKGCKSNVDHDNCWGPQVPFASDEDAMVG